MKNRIGQFKQVLKETMTTTDWVVSAIMIAVGSALIWRIRKRTIEPKFSIIIGPIVMWAGMMFGMLRLAGKKGLELAVAFIVGQLLVGLGIYLGLRGGKTKREKQSGQADAKGSASNT